MKEINVSVIITTRNEEEHLADCLRSVKNQSYPQDQLEIIVVDNNSTDKTKAIASKFTSQVFNFGPERSAQRNFGISKAGGKYIIYLDADMVLSEDVLSRSVRRCEDKDYAALYIPEKIIGQGFWIKVRDFERSFYNASCIDVVRFIRREAALKIDGFDETLNGPEDWDFDRRVREIGRTGIISACLFHNEGSFTLFRYVAKKRYYARGFGRYIEKWGRGDPIIRKQFGVYYRYLGVFIEKEKWKKIVAHPILTVSMFLLRITVGFVFLYSRYFKP
ncbi:MAG: glycosyltransferase [Candidatus Euphemobacter frigidus]|nr:glycosyltransferase [Candidatus Euphemobacter frigidus]MDP8275313.1 glycosyltransferase [Candidatus Euphemobacter frigidus]